MKLYFENTFGNSRQIAECHTENDIMPAINHFIDECNKSKSKDKQFKSYYIRTWSENGKTWYDVGSHTEFFWVDKELVK